MYLGLLLKTLFKGIDWVLKVSLLVLVFLLDVRVDFNILNLLLFDIGVEVFIDCTLELVKVINELDCAIDSIGKTLNENVVSPNLRPILLYYLLHILLAGPQIINNVTKVGIYLVEMLQVLVHIVCLLLQASDFHLARSDVSLELLNLVVEDELELLKFLCLFL